MAETQQVSGYFNPVTTQQFSQNNPLAREVVSILLKNKPFSYELIEKGFLAPDGKTIINPIDLQRLIGEAMKATRQDVGDPAKLVAQKVMHMLGASEVDTAGIPPQAYDAPLGTQPIRGQNRVAYMRMSNVDFRHGLMLGGIGTGGIERTPQGSFRRVGMTTVRQNVEDTQNQNQASQMHLFMKTPSRTFSSVLNTDANRDTTKLTDWKWDLAADQGSYHALYPREWHVYEGEALPGKVSVNSFSPVIKGNYRESSLPVVVYKVTLKNTSTEPMDAAFMMSMQNIVGWEPHSMANTWDGAVSKEVDRQNALGIHHVTDPKAIKDYEAKKAVGEKSCHNTTILTEQPSRKGGCFDSFKKQ
uniref:GH116 family glycosyl-hydrolase n=1 Tax=Candidatus Magnetaquicoccus inordinatus TaxID=2496818 RepID=UPI001D0E0A3A